jgi:hypothetical protein
MVYVKGEDRVYTELTTPMTRGPVRDKSAPLTCMDVRDLCSYWYKMRQTECVDIAKTRCMAAITCQLLQTEGEDVLFRGYLTAPLLTDRLLPLALPAITHHDHGVA